MSLLCGDGIIPDDRRVGQDAIQFFVAGRPRATQTGSVITVRGRTFPLRRNTSWSTLCGLVARQHAPVAPLTGPVDVAITFILPRPKARRREHLVATRPNIDGLAKGLLDSWNGVLWQDDGQVAVLHLEKVYEDELSSVGVLVRVRPVTLDGRA